MMWTAISRRLAVGLACLGGVLATPAGAMALTTHAATATVPNSNGVLVATANCGANEHVVSGGFRSPHASDSSAIVSRAVHGDSWTIHLYPETPPLTTYAYCAPNGQFSISSHAHKVTASVAGANTTATARCASGEKVVSGGYIMSPVSATDANSPNFKDYAAGSGKWTVMSIFAIPPGNLVAWGYCARGVTVQVRSNTSHPIATDSNGSATASCQPGETLLAGGYTTTPTPDWDNVAGPDIFYAASYRSGRRSWTARGTNFSMVSGKITSFAYCEP